MIIKTNNINIDYRVNKECNTLLKQKLKIKIFSLESDNKSRKGITSYNVPYKSTRLLSRRIFPQRKFLAIKSFEFYIKIFFFVLANRSKIIWLHDMHVHGVVPFLILLRKWGFIKNIIWDQHELPNEKLLKKKLNHNMIRYGIRKCNTVIGANIERINYLAKRLKLEETNNFVSIENYVDRQFMNYPKKELPGEILEWLGSDKYIISLSANLNPKRYLNELIGAIIQDNKFKIIIVGGFTNEDKRKLINEYGKELIHSRCYFTGFLPQMEVIKYLDHAYASAMFYSHDIMNNKLCAPNRLYQSLSRGTPVITGSNPPMRRVIKQHKCGIIIESDGQSIKEIVIGLNKIEVDYQSIKGSTEKARNYFTWELQEDKLIKIVK